MQLHLLSTILAVPELCKATPRMISIAASAMRTCRNVRSARLWPSKLCEKTRVADAAPGLQTCPQLWKAKWAAWAGGRRENSPAKDLLILVPAFLLGSWLEEREPRKVFHRRLLLQQSLSPASAQLQALTNLLGQCELVPPKSSLVSAGTQPWL